MAVSVSDSRPANASTVSVMECEICGAEVVEQPVRIVDSRKDPDKRTNEPPPRRYAVAVIPFVCPKCGHEQFSPPADV